MIRARSCWIWRSARRSAGVHGEPAVSHLAEQPQQRGPDGLVPARIARASPVTRRRELSFRANGPGRHLSSPPTDGAAAARPPGRRSAHIHPGGRARPSRRPSSRRGRPDHRSMGMSPRPPRSDTDRPNRRPAGAWSPCCGNGPVNCSGASSISSASVRPAPPVSVWVGTKRRRVVLAGYSRRQASRPFCHSSMMAARRAVACS
jgi:hypothetical protein